MRAKGFTAAADDGTLLGALTRATGSLLGTDFAVGAVDFEAGFAGGGALAGVVAFEGDGVVEDVSAEREVEVLDGPLLEGGGFEGGEAVDCYGDGCDWRLLDVVA